MPNTFQLKYDEMEAIAKKFRQQGEDIGRLHDVTRQRVRDIQKEWIGDAAVKFTKEMEEVLLPALKRLSQALLYTQDVSLDISKIIRTADEETAAYFKDRLSGDDFGAGKFGDALQGLQGMRAGADDFGAGQFGAALGGLSGGGGGSTPDDFGAGKFGEALGGAPGGGGGSVADDFGAGKFQE
ncbi:MAG: WXG100 family type VII secretion target, partial [Anaerolineales bacterium]